MDKTKGNWGLYVLIFFIVVYSLFPFYYAIVTSFKTGSELFQVDYWIRSFNLENYKTLFATQDFFTVIFNSVLVAFSTVVLSLLFGLTSAFVLGKIQFRGRGTIMAAILMVSMFPQIAVLSGLYTLIQAMGLYNHWFGLTVSYLIFTLPFTIWVLTSFIKQIPRELEEAAQMDGANPLERIFYIYLPLLAPACVTTGLLAFIGAWNEFLFALTFTVNEKARTIPVAITLISGASQYELPFGAIMAASVLVTLPLIFLVLIFQKRIVQGLTAGAVKG